MNALSNRIQALLKLSDNIPDDEKRLQIQRTLRELDQAIQRNVTLEKVLVRLEAELPKEVRRAI